MEHTTTTKRYEVRIILSNTPDAEGKLIQPLGEVVGSSDDLAEANRIADQHGTEHYYGVAILDTIGRTVDWGTETTGLTSDEYGTVVIA